MRARFMIAGVVFLLGAALLALAWTTKSLPPMLLGAALLLAAAGTALARGGGLTVAAVTVLAFLAAVEWGLGLAAAEGPPEPVYQPDTYYRPLADLGYGLRPGVYRVHKGDGKGGLIYDAVYTIGPDGFRNTPQVSGAEPARVNVFGGSFTFGEGLNDDKTVPAFLAQALDGVEVRNFGVHGYGVNQALAILESGRDTAGDANVLMTFSGHALRSACRRTYQIGAPRYTIGDDGLAVREGECLGFLDNPAGRPFKKSRIVELVLATLAETRREQDLRLYEAMVHRFIALSRERGQIPLVAFLPNMGYSPEHETAQVELMENLRRDGDPVVDATLLEDDGTLDPRHILHPLDTHPSAEANARRAGILAEALRPQLTSSVAVTGAP